MMFLAKRIGIVLFAVLAIASDVAADQSSPTVGAPGRVEGVVLPGPELKGKPITDGSSMIVRVVEVFPHGDAYRYTLEFQGLEPGVVDLTNWLVPKDESQPVELPPVTVEIKSLLPPGQIEPNRLEVGWLPNLGGYRRVAIVLAALWIGVLGYLVWPRRGHQDQVEKVAPSEPLSARLRRHLEAAMEGQAEVAQFAELERMLVALWRRRLNLESVPLADAVAQIKQNPESGPLMIQLERWVHAPPDRRDVDLKALLEPYESMPADCLDTLGPPEKV